MLNYAAVSPISLPDGVRFWMDESFRIGDRFFRRGQKVVYGEDTPKYFLLECGSKGKKKITFVNKNDIKESNKQYIDIMVVDNLYQINEAQGVQSDEFNTYKTDWQATIVPLSRHGTGQSSGRDAINSLRPQERLWARKVFDRGHDFASRSDWGMLPLSFEKIYWRLNNRVSIVTRYLITMFQGIFNSELNIRDDNEREFIDYNLDDFDPSDFPFLMYKVNADLENPTDYFRDLDNQYSGQFDEVFVDHGSVYQSSLIVRGEDVQFSKGDDLTSIPFGLQAGLVENRPATITDIELLGLTICSRI